MKNSQKNRGRDEQLGKKKKKKEAEYMVISSRNIVFFFFSFITQVPATICSFSHYVTCLKKKKKNTNFDWC